MTFKISKEFSIGLLVIATVAILFFGINYLKGINLFNPTNYYYVKFKDASGLVESSAVTCRGVKIGLVKQIIYDYDNPSSDVVAVLQVDNSLRIPKDSKAILVIPMMGGTTIALDLNRNTGLASFYEKGDTIPSITPADMLTNISNEVIPIIERLLPHIDSLVVSINKLANNQDIYQSLANINVMTRNLDHSTVMLNKMLRKDLPPILADAKHITGNFTTVSDNLAGIDFQGTMKGVDSTLRSLDQIAADINSGKGTLGLLVNDRTMYDNLNSTVGNADKLMIDLKENPKRYVHFSVFAPKEKKAKKED